MLTKALFNESPVWMGFLNRHVFMGKWYLRNRQLLNGYEILHEQDRVLLFVYKEIVYFDKT